jgi:hypothetical protein
MVGGDGSLGGGSGWPYRALMSSFVSTLPKKNHQHNTETHLKSTGKCRAQVIEITTSFSTAKLEYDEHGFNEFTAITNLISIPAHKMLTFFFLYITNYGYNEVYSLVSWNSL